MASFEPLIRMNENAFRAPEKMQSKTGRKPLGDVTNSSKPLAKDKSLAKNFNVFKVQENQLKTNRKPLSDLTNSNKPRANEKSSKKNCIDNLSAVDEDKDHSWNRGERFLHNHNECVKAQRQSMNMSEDYFLETVALKRDSSLLMSAPKLSQVSTATELELMTHLELDKLKIDILDIGSLPAPKSPSTPKSPMSLFSNIDWMNLEFVPLKLKESPARKESVSAWSLLLQLDRFEVVLRLNDFGTEKVKVFKSSVILGQKKKNVSMAISMSPSVCNGHFQAPNLQCARLETSDSES